ncbi:glucosylceramidase [Flavobacterium sp. 90]|uniref:glycoside hydrolase family 30 protein n=1 Tax=unclassified Flavobacterium TaxID=196869 RepID=UPI000EABA1C2|nr:MULTISPECIES: glycoside hydrolase family 30 beta sandwich domain-containing protein [unclassified Flavobacterium]RKR08951.1 glucosylceramidase [Flavobacterium sp. 81]TCK52739.1 glucosylceramidase [Flavobacterium sp. 90]
MKNIVLSFLLIIIVGCASKKVNTEWVSTTESTPWEIKEIEGLTSASETESIEIFTRRPLQEIEGFGSCFNELGWTSLSALSAADRSAIMKELYEPGTGAGFTIGRMPIGANDFSRDWYSYDETEGDFTMKNFSIENDKQTLVPFIKAAQKYNKDLKLWASPWSPPQWMKYNRHYALNKVPTVIKNTENGITEKQLGKEGTDMFIQKPEYFDAYALYFEKFIEAYKTQGIKISMVMPQNEFNSAQWYPSCTWTKEGLIKFINVLAPRMKKVGVQTFFGTLERPDKNLFSDVYKEATENINGIGLQWAGKEAVEVIHKQYPNLKIYQSEHECGNGKNDWDYAVYSWDLMKHYFMNGTNAYLYWNTSLLKGGVSRWGWKQNSLLSIDASNKTYKWNNEYYLMKHLSHFVKPGSRMLETSSTAVVNHRNDVLGFWKGDLMSNKENLLAFKNSDGSIVVVVYNESSSLKKLNIKINNTVISPELEPKSFNTFLIKQ